MDLGRRPESGHSATDAAIDPRVLLDTGPLDGRQAGLWVENLLLAAEPLAAFWGRHLRTLAVGGGIGLLFVDLRLALARGRIHAHYQPVIDLATSGICADSSSTAPA